MDREKQQPEQQPATDDLVRHVRSSPDLRGNGERTYSYLVGEGLNREDARLLALEERDSGW